MSFFILILSNVTFYFEREVGCFPSNFITGSFLKAIWWLLEELHFKALRHWL